MNNKIEISNSHAKQRIDKFLAGFYPEKSRAGWQKGIKNKEVLVNDKIVKADYVLKKNDEVEILKPPPTLFLVRRGEIKIPDMEIIYEDNEVIVLNKPAGVLSQNAKSSKSPSITDFLLKRCPKIKNVGEGEMRFGVVHRLDKDTSGIIIGAKNNRSFDFLKKQFRERKTEKEYQALVYGKVKDKQGMVDLAIARSKKKFDQQTAVDTVKKENLKSRNAITFYEVIKYFKDYTLLKVIPKTGRMHQIRVHLKAIGHPVVGDQKYKFRKLPAANLKRQFLHAVKLKITLPSGKVKVFKSGLPNDLKEFLGKLE